MTQRLQIVPIVCSSVPPSDNVIHVGRCDWSTFMLAERIGTQRMPTQKQEPQSAPVRTIAALAGAATCLLVVACVLPVLVTVASIAHKRRTS